MTRTTIRSEDITAGQVKSADLASDAVNTSGLEDDIALLGFKVASNGSLGKYNLVDQTIDDFQDASGIDASGSTDEVRNASNYYSGGVFGNATGGTVTTYTSGSTDYKVHSFLSGATNFVPAGSGTVDLFIVAGGGAGGWMQAGYASSGGGAGGVRVLPSTSIASGTWVATVGAGGVGNLDSSLGDGEDSTFVLGGTSYTATGGGGGSGNQANGRDGGSGSGARAGTGGASSPVTSPVQGHAGSTYNDGGYHAGGGGGWGAAGSVRNGGNGATNDYRTGSNVTYAGGGGGGTGGTGGTGGGGQGSTTNGAGGFGGANTGGGGGGSKYYAGTAPSASSGGSGIIVVRYVEDSFVAYNDMTLVSNATTAEATPTNGDIVMTYTNGAGTATINTDLKAWISRDNGTTYTQATLSSEGTTGGHTILTAHDVDISSQPSGTSMRYKITTHNQSASKETRIQAVSLGWS